MRYHLLLLFLTVGQILSQNCFQDNVKLVGKLINRQGITKNSSQECFSLCEATLGCLGMTYYMEAYAKKNQRKGCKMFKKILNTTNDTNVISAVAKDCLPDGVLYIVDASNGNDNNDGQSVDRPFKSIQRCVDQLINPGDECQIRTGRYHEEVHVSGIAGTAEKPLKIRGFGDEVPIWDGTVDIQPSSWAHDPQTGICKAKLDQDIFALLLNEDLLTPARWPNALWSDLSVFNSSQGWRHFDPSSSPGTVVDPKLEDEGIDATGAMAILNVGSWITFVRQVDTNEKGSDRFTYTHDFCVQMPGQSNPPPNCKGIWYVEHNKYYLEASLSLLDAPEEWFYDMDTKTLHLIPPKGNSGCPISLQGRTIDYGLTVNNTQHLIIANISFFAANIHVDDVDEVIVDSLRFKFPSSSHRMLKSNATAKDTIIRAKAGCNGLCPQGRITVVNSTFVGGEGSALRTSGVNAYVHNNLFAYNDWSGQGNIQTVMFKSRNGEFSQNTLWYNGVAHGLGYTGRNDKISLNRIAGTCWGLIQQDGAAIQIPPASAPDAPVSNNWIHDSPKNGIRFDGYEGQNGYQGFNVIWNQGREFYPKGDNHTIENNLAYDDNNNSSCTLCVPSHKGSVVMNLKTIVRNNAAQKQDIGGGSIYNNYNCSDVKTHLIDPDNQDFRPVEGGPLTQGNITIGPYQPGKGSISKVPGRKNIKTSIYWIPGRKTYKTSNPIPKSGATVPKNRDVLMCLGGYKADKHHFYFGTNKKSVENAGIKNKAFKFTSVEGNIFRLGRMKRNRTYYWRVDAERNGQIFKGDVWNFVTMKK